MKRFFRLEMEDILWFAGKKIRVCALIASLAACLCLCGCTIGGKKVFFSITNPLIVFSIGQADCNIKEAKVYLANYKNIYGTIGESSLWSEGFDTTEIEEGIKHSAIYHLSRVYLLDIYARETGVSLEASEEDKVAKAAEKYFGSLNEKEKKACNVSLRDIRKMYEHYALAGKAYSKVMQSVDEEVSEDEARIMDALILYVKPEKKYLKVKDELSNGADFESLLSAYSDGEKGEVSFGRGEYPPEVEKAAFSLANQEVSKGVKAEDGYYFIKCIHKYNETLSEENKTRIIEERKQRVFQGIVDSQSKKYYSYINLPLVDKIHLDLDPSIKTDSFFSVIEDEMDFD